ncbi:response regulator [Desulfosarcina sp.]|uniref:hybrid sensor histidine kinase/response regulator n=1 Tax=Desulfosarcina sp. TaxID=2027861 RepID=UPI00356887F2
MKPSANDSLMQQLEESKQRANYWKKIAQQTGRLRLREAENLSALIQSLKYTKECLINEIRDRRQAEEALRKNQEDVRAILDATLETIVLIDRQGTVIVSNKTACDRLKTSRKKIIGQCIYDFFPLDVAEKRRRKYLSVFASGKPVTFEDNRDGMEFEQCVYPVFGDGNKVEKIAVFARDISERLRFERMFQQSQKFKSIGTLAGGIAHDFNNLMMSIQGWASLISIDLEPSHPHADHIKAIEHSIRNASHLTEQLLGFARGGQYEARPIDINELLLGSAIMFGRTKKEINIHTKLQRLPLVVEADRRQIEQVLLNLYINAWQAMTDGGELYLETRTLSLDDDHCKLHQVKAGRYAEVSITDTGIGMDESIRQQIFDPFFTTKQKSRGTGLGLASAYGIIKNHGGFITVNSQVGQGTKFNIYLPISKKKVAREAPTGNGLVKGSETILLVEDEEMVIKVGQAMLEKLGYQVITASDGHQAVDAVRKKGAGIDLVILDLIMPVMGGDKAFDLIREIQPGMPIILSSGYSLNGQAKAIMQNGCNDFIQKPFNISKLSKMVRKILNDNKVAATSEAPRY